MRYIDSYLWAPRAAISLPAPEVRAQLPLQRQPLHGSR